MLVAVTLTAAAYLVPSLLGYERYVITGGSMSGAIERGSVVFSRAVPAEDLRVGDVITYQPPAESGVTTLVTHRIVRIGRDDVGRQVLRTQGDANPDPDPWRFTLTDDEQAVVQVSVPYVGYALIALADRDTRMLVIGVPAGLVGLVSLGQLVGALRSRLRPPAGTTVVTAGPL
ncbi:signal peptidase I [Nocardioides immobilis]|uniref:Signal peptidase I n=2 Tax=Nocardioides immobilis TaxID=2049295 RepID=A0A417Y1N0_9ACTN|nr:signal peptidase I [Nocardioides immobilis]